MGSGGHIMSSFVCSTHKHHSINMALCVCVYNISLKRVTQAIQLEALGLVLAGCTPLRGGEGEGGGAIAFMFVKSVSLNGTVSFCTKIAGTGCISSVLEITL